MDKVKAKSQQLIGPQSGQIARNNRHSICVKPIFRLVNLLDNTYLFQFIFGKILRKLFLTRVPTLRKLCVAKYNFSFVYLIEVDICVFN